MFSSSLCHSASSLLLFSFPFSSFSLSLSLLVLSLTVSPVVFCRCSSPSTGGCQGREGSSDGSDLSSSSSATSSLRWPPNFHLRFLERVRLIDGFESIRRLPEIEEEVRSRVLSGDSHPQAKAKTLPSTATHAAAGPLVHSSQTRQQGEANNNTVNCT